MDLPSSTRSGQSGGDEKRSQTKSDKGLKEVSHREAEVDCVDRDHLRDLIVRHPFFKNPNHYHIRLITIMKYLKKKGLDVRIKDIDLIVDEVILTIEGVRKIGEDRYALKK